MRDPFAAALDAQFNAPGSAAAVYTGANGIGVPIRVIVSRPDEDRPFGSTRIVKASAAVSLRVSDIANPVPGDTFALTATGAVMRLYGEPMIDNEGLSWTCGAVAEA